MIDISKITLNPLPKDVKILTEENSALKKSNRTLIILGLGLGLLAFMGIVAMTRINRNEYEKQQ